MAIEFLTNAASAAYGYAGTACNAVGAAATFAATETAKKTTAAWNWSSPKALYGAQKAALWSVDLGCVLAAAGLAKYTVLCAKDARDEFHEGHYKKAALNAYGAAVAILTAAATVKYVWDGNPIVANWVGLDKKTPAV